MNNKIIIKPMQTVEEMDGKAYVHWKSWQETYAGLIDANYLANNTLEKCQAVARRFPNDILIAMDGNRVIGFVGYGAYRDKSATGLGEIYGIYVLEEYQKQGIGYALMNAAMEKLSAYQKIALWVLRGNQKAIPFYERYGFRFDGAEMPVTMGTPNMEFRMIFSR